MDLSESLVNVDKTDSSDLLALSVVPSRTCEPSARWRTYSSVVASQHIKNVHAVRE